MKKTGWIWWTINKIDTLHFCLTACQLKEYCSLFKENPIGRMQVLNLVTYSNLVIKYYQKQNWWKSNEAGSSYRSIHTKFKLPERQIIQSVAFNIRNSNIWWLSCLRDITISLIQRKIEGRVYFAARFRWSINVL